jgi:hypothetical protein
MLNRLASPQMFSNARAAKIATGEIARTNASRACHRV